MTVEPDNILYNKGSPLRSLKQKPFILNFTKSLNKKLVQCDRIKFKVEQKSGNTILSYNTGSYDLVRSMLFDFYNLNPNIYVENVENIDKDGNCVGCLIKVSDSTKRGTKGRHLYTLNLYHTTSRMMVNGQFSQRFVKNDLPVIETIIEHYDDIIMSNNDLVKTSLSKRASVNVNKETNSAVSDIVATDLQKKEEEKEEEEEEEVNEKLLESKADVRNVNKETNSTVSDMVVIDLQKEGEEEKVNGKLLESKEDVRNENEEKNEHCSTLPQILNKVNALGFVSDLVFVKITDGIEGNTESESNVDILIENSNSKQIGECETGLVSNSAILDRLNGLESAICDIVKNQRDGLFEIMKTKYVEKENEVIFLKSRVQNLEKSVESLQSQQSNRKKNDTEIIKRLDRTNELLYRVNEQQISFSQRMDDLEHLLLKRVDSKNDFVQNVQTIPIENEGMSKLNKSLSHVISQENPPTHKPISPTLNKSLTQVSSQENTHTHKPTSHTPIRITETTSTAEEENRHLDKKRSDEWTKVKMSRFREPDHLLISNSHGQGLDPKMLKPDFTLKKVLEKGKKNIQGAHDFVKETNVNPQKSVVFQVLDNDVASNKSVDDIVDDMRALLQFTKEKFGSSIKIKILEPIGRNQFDDQKNKMYNEKANIIVKKLRDLKSEFVIDIIICPIQLRTAGSRFFKKDSGGFIHLNNDGNLKLMNAFRWEYGVGRPMRVNHSPNFVEKHHVQSHPSDNRTRAFLDNGPYLKNNNHGQKKRELLEVLVDLAKKLC